MTSVVVGSEVRKMFGSIADRYDLTNTVLSFGQHFLWRAALKKTWQELPRDSKVLDLCCGTGDVYRDLTKRFKHAVGLDFSLPMLKNGKEKFCTNTNNSDLSSSEARGLGALQGDALKTPFGTDCFDFVVVSFGMRNLESLEEGLREIHRILKSSGKLVVLDFGKPTLPVWSQIFLLYSKYVMPFIGEMLTGNRSAYEYLPETSQRFPSGKDFVAILEDEGFSVNNWRALSGGIAYLYEGIENG